VNAWRLACPPRSQVRQTGKPPAARAPIHRERLNIPNQPSHVCGFTTLDLGALRIVHESLLPSDAGQSMTVRGNRCSRCHSVVGKEQPGHRRILATCPQGDQTVLPQLNRCSTTTACLRDCHNLVAMSERAVARLPWRARIFCAHRVCADRWSNSSSIWSAPRRPHWRSSWVTASPPLGWE